jgi:hypothetical protein
MIPSVLLAGIFSMLFALPFALRLSVSTGDLGLLAIMGVVQLGAGLLLMSVWVLIGERPSQAALIGGGMGLAALVANEIASLRQPLATSS